MGTALLPRVERDDLGLPLRPLELLNLEHPDWVQGVHRSFLEAGAEVLTTNTFQASRRTFERFGISREVEAACRAGVRLALEVLGRNSEDAVASDGGRRAHLLGSIGPGFESPSRGGVDTDDLRNAFRDQARWLLEEGVDGILIETFRDPLALEMALDACLEARAGGPAEILVTLALDADARFPGGIEVDATLALLAERGIRNWGLNCMAPGELEAAVSVLLERGRRPRIASPNAGLPRIEDGVAVHPVTVGEFVEVQRRLQRSADLRGLGGCCGTDARHIEALRSALDRRTPD